MFVSGFPHKSIAFLIPTSLIGRWSNWFNMCDCAAIIALNQFKYFFPIKSKSDLFSRLKKTLLIIQHRGSDSQSYWINFDERVDTRLFFWLMIPVHPKLMLVHSQFDDRTSQFWWSYILKTSKFICFINIFNHYVWFEKYLYFDRFIINILVVHKIKNFENWIKIEYDISYLNWDFFHVRNFDVDWPRKIKYSRIK